MYTIIKNTCMVLAAGTLLASCKKFEEINVDPIAANIEQVQVEYFINNSIGGAQQDPHIAERAFVLYWETAGHTSLNTSGGLATGGYDDGWSSDYYSYISGWLNAANTAIQVADEKAALGNVQPYTNNLKQIARIWRAYLMSELADNFGPIPINSFQGTNPGFSDLKGVYYHLLDELKDAVSKMDASVANPNNLKDLDPAYGYNYANWIKYANSMRLRLSMRLSEVDPGKAKSEFEAAVTGALIKAGTETFQVAERPGWDPYSGVMTREWNPHFMTATLNTLYTGLGGIKTADQNSAYSAYAKPADYIGMKFDQHFPTNTNYPMIQYWLDGLPNTIDPRAYKTYIPPGDFTNANFNSYPSWDATARTTTRSLNDASGTAQKSIDAKFHWNAFPGGDWGTKGPRNQIRLFGGTIPRLSHAFRANSNKRVFFAPWETYFLIAEAAVRGWNVPMSGKAAYEEGIKASFEYWGVSSHLTAYLASQDYNRAGTSVNWEHTAEPPATYTMKFVDGYTNAAGTATINYPKNDLYKSGTVRNDLLTKVITQKFIAQTPWLPLETWSDQRRLGLPFIENPVVENPLPNMPALTSGNYMTRQVQFFPQRLRYPSGLKNSNAAGYEQAVSFLGGADAVLTPLWWAKKQ